MKSLLAILLLASPVWAQAWTRDADTDRNFVGACAWCDTSATPNVVYVFGGSGEGHPQQSKQRNFSQKVAVYARRAGKWSWQDHPTLTSPNLTPSLRFWAEGRAEYLAAHGTAVCVSGDFYDGVLSSTTKTRVWTFRNGAFSRPKVTGEAPSDRYYFASATDGSRFFLFGGVLPSISTKDPTLYILSRVKLGEWRWTRHAPAGTSPGSLYLPKMVHDGSTLWLFGGQEWRNWGDINRHTYRAVVPTSGPVKWIRSPLHEDSSNRQWRGAAWYDPTSKMVWRFGAASKFERVEFDALQAATPIGWQEPVLGARPGPRFRCQGVWMPSERAALILGGWRKDSRYGLFLYNDSWRFTPSSPTQLPPPR